MILQKRVWQVKTNIVLMFWVLFFCGLGSLQNGFAQGAAGTQFSPWVIIKQKTFPNYKVEIYQRKTASKIPQVESMKARIIPGGGGSVTEVFGTQMTPDPREYGIGWGGALLDVDGDGLEDLVLKNYSGGAHCCFNYILYSLKKPLTQLGDISMQDCGEKVLLEDLNADKKLEIVSCDATYIYLGSLPYAQSPFPPAIYTLKGSQYERADKEFKQVFISDIGAQRESLTNGYNPASILQIVTDYLLIGDEKKAWEEFDALYQGEDKENIRQQILKRYKP